VAAWAVRGRSSAAFGPSVWRGTTSRKAIALTFDDGPSESTLRLLDLLGAYSLPATFFQVGNNVRRLPELARATVDRGHELGNHSQTHPNFALTSPEFVAQEFTEAQKSIAEATGKSPVWLRAPYGVRWFGFSAAQKALGLTGVMWSVIGRDWVLPADAIARRVLDRTTPGGIICLHDGRGTLKNPDVEATLEAVRRIVPALLEQGYRFETLSELLCPKN
jgi:peptidoglycan/xylan/chitin deacetylase (PgdA/CDA1 family)